MIKPAIDFSQYGQPSSFRQFIPPDIPQWVVDVGAHDGINGSNSRQLVLDGWSAILVKPLPNAFKKLERVCDGLSQVHVCQCACADFDGPATFYIGIDGPDGQASSLNDEDAWRPNHSGEAVSVPVRRLTSILEQYGCPQTFGVLLIDVESLDLEVLRGLDFERFRPAVICTEKYEANPDKDRVKNDLLSALGYQLREEIGSDVIWTCSQLVGENCWPAGPTLYRGFALPEEIALRKNDGKGVAWLGKPIRTSEGFLICGWGIAPNQSIPGIVLVGLERDDDMIEFVQSARHPRADVARHFQDEKFLFTGFVACWKGGMSPGLSRFRVIQCSGNRRWENAVTVSAAG